MLPLWLAKFGLSAFGFSVPLRFWIFGFIAIAIALLAWRFVYLQNTVKNYKAAVEVEQNRVDGNRELIEELSEKDDVIMHQQIKRAEEAGKKAKNWLRKQDPEVLKKGYAPKGYTKQINEVE